MTGYIIRRILWSIPVLLLLTFVIFSLMRAIPGGPFDFVGDKSLPKSVVQNLERRHHLDWALGWQFSSYVLGDDITGGICSGLPFLESCVAVLDSYGLGVSEGLVRGDLGMALKLRGRTVNDLVKESFPISFQLGIIADLTFSHVPEYEAVESYNVGDDSLYEVTGEETTLTVEIRQFDHRMLELAIGTGTKIDLGSESVTPFGAGCTILRRPYSLQFTNASCWAPSSQDISLGVSGGAVTLYDCFVQSGLEWAMNSKESNTVPLELQALPVLERTAGMRLGNLYLY